MLIDISDFDGLDDIKEAYLKTDKEMEYVPMDGVYAMPYMANASGVLYNKDMFEEHGWTIPTTWDKFTALCERIEAKGFSRCILDSKIPKPVWLRGMRSPQIWLRLMFGGNKGIPFTDNYRVAEKEKRFWHMPRIIRQHTDTTMRVQHLPKVSLRCL